MPNWVKNNLRIKLNGEKALEVLEMIKDEAGNMTFSKVSPLPEELEDTTSPVPDNVAKKERRRLQKLYGADNWYDWQCNNWGCKWDASESSFYQQDGYDMVTFQTAWTPPFAFMKTLSETFPKVTFELQFEEESETLFGKAIFQNGIINVYAPADPREDTSEILNAIWDEEWVEDKFWKRS